MFILMQSYNIGIDKPIFFKNKEEASVALNKAYQAALNEAPDHPIHHETYCTPINGQVVCESGDFWCGVIMEI